MHKSWGNAIEFDEAAERMGVDVMRWMYASARPDDNILFGWHAADEARRGLLVLWNVYAFFVTYARLAEWHPGSGEAPSAERGAARPLDPVPGGGDGRRGRDEPGRLRRSRRGPLAIDVVRRRPLDVVPAPVPSPLVASRPEPRSTGRVRDAPRRPRRA